MTDCEQWLQVVERTVVADGVVLVSFEHPDGAVLPPWEPGAHLEIVLPSGLVRHYSLCGEPEDRHRYTVAVLNVQDGRGGSREVHESDLVGQQVVIRGPRNHFELEDADEYLFIAGGIGITPISAMVTRAQAEGRSWRLIYGGRSRASMAFWDRLAALAPDRVAFVPQDTAGLPDLGAAIRQASPTTAVYACGPTGMLDVVQDLANENADRVTLTVERFTAAESTAPQEGDTAFEVELKQTGKVLTVGADQTILDAVLEVVANHPYSCTEGVCGSCETAVLEGVPDHRDQVLTDFERSTNETMMICVGRSLSKRLVLDL